MTIADEIERLKKLRDEGTLSQEEFEEAKENALNRDRPVGKQLKDQFESFAGDENTYCMILHLSKFCYYLAPFAGIIVPIVLWIAKKDESAAVDAHGRIVLNWLITETIYAVIAGLLCFILIGIPLAFALTIIAIVFPIVGALKAKDGVIWNYPGTIRIL